MNMTAKNRIAMMIVLIALAFQFGRPARAAVNEERQGEANPSAVIFHATLFGAGTGLLLGGAYALVDKSNNTDTWDILRWSVAGGTLLGFIVGVVYVTTRSGPNDSPQASKFLGSDAGGPTGSRAIRLQPVLAIRGGGASDGRGLGSFPYGTAGMSADGRHDLAPHRSSPEIALKIVTVQF